MIDVHQRRSLAAQQGWETRRANDGAGICASCGTTGRRLYSVPDLHEERDLCIDCSQALINVAVAA